MIRCWKGLTKLTQFLVGTGGANDAGCGLGLVERVVDLLPLAGGGAVVRVRVVGALGADGGGLIEPLQVGLRQIRMLRSLCARLQVAQ